MAKITNGLTFLKTGAEIVAQAKAKADYLQGAIDSTTTMMNNIMNAQRVKPNEFLPRYVYDGYEHKIPTFQRYSYELLYRKDSLADLGYAGTASLKDDTITMPVFSVSPNAVFERPLVANDLCQDDMECAQRALYNSLLMSCVEMYVQLCACNTILESLDVSQTFELDEWEMKKLGF